MQQGDKQLGKPQILYKDTKANITALSGVAEGAVAYATDTDEIGTYNGTTWDWLGISSALAHIASTSNPHAVTAAQVVAIPESGWIACSETWTRTGNYTFTVSGDVTAKFRKGAKIRYKDGGAFEYGVVGSSSYSAPTTTITLITNDDYAMAAATITDRWISFVENPEGFPHWFNYANTVEYSASGSMTFTSVVTAYAKWKANGTTMQVLVLGTGTTGGTASNILRATAPVTSDGFNIPMVAAYRDSSTGGAPVGTGAMSAGYLSVWRADLANFGLGTGRILYISGFFTF